MVDAGRTVPGFTQEAQGVEFFVHSPFGSRLDDGTLVDRNTDSIVVQASFLADGKVTKVILGSDVDHCALTEIVNVTKYHKRQERLEWDIFKLPHHCSYLSLGPEKGKDKTTPVAEVKWLIEDQGQSGAIVVSSSKPIPSNDNDALPAFFVAAPSPSMDLTCSMCCSIDCFCASNPCRAAFRKPLAAARRSIR